MREKKIGLFGKIESRDDALKVIKESSYGFLLVAAILGVARIFTDPSNFIDVVLVSILALNL
jgi:hypothetical protein